MTLTRVQPNVCVRYFIAALGTTHLVPEFCIVVLRKKKKYFLSQFDSVVSCKFISGLFEIHLHPNPYPRLLCLLLGKWGGGLFVCFPIFTHINNDVLAIVTKKKERKKS